MSHNIICYYSLFNLTDEEYEKKLPELLSDLSKERTVKAEKCSKAWDKFNSCYSYRLLGYALRKWTGDETMLNPKLFYKANGKPYITDYPNVFFSVSHVKGGVCVAVSDKEVGVDILDTRPMNDLLVNKIIPDDSLTPQEAYTRLEAISKLSGRGIGEIMENLHKNIDMLSESYLNSNNIIVTSKKIEKGEADFFISTASHNYRCDSFVNTDFRNIINF